MLYPPRTTYPTKANTIIRAGNSQKDARRFNNYSLTLGYAPEGSRRALDERVWACSLNQSSCLVSPSRALYDDGAMMFCIDAIRRVKC